MWTGASRRGKARAAEELRRWAQLPLEHVFAALEEMQELSEMLSEESTPGEKRPPGNK